MSEWLCASMPEIWFAPAFIVVIINAAYLERKYRKHFKTTEEWLGFQLSLIMGAHDDDRWIWFVRRFMLFWMLSFFVVPLLWFFGWGKSVCN